MNPYSAKAEILIRAPASRVWEALTSPELIKKYLFGTEAVSDWKEGSSITYRGVWDGKPYEDHGTILKIQPTHLLSTTYWSALSGLPDTPENRNTVTYSLSSEGDGTKLTITQDNIASEDSKNHSEKNWEGVLMSLKNLLEEPAA